MSDFENYQTIEADLKNLRRQHGSAALNLPEYQAGFRALEKIKNRHNGFQPIPDHHDAGLDLSGGTAAMAAVILLLLALCLPVSAADEKTPVRLAPFFYALRAVETGGRSGAILGDDGEALGPYQIHRAYWQDSKVAGRYEQCADEAYARRVVLAYLTRYAPAAVQAGDFETLARIHNGGPRGARKAATLAYWRKVEKHLSEWRRNPSRLADPRHPESVLKRTASLKFSQTTPMRHALSTPAMSPAITTTPVSCQLVCTGFLPHASRPLPRTGFSGVTF